MAKGDAKVAVQTVSAGATWNIQPASGEEWFIKRCGCETSNGYQIYLTDGSVISKIKEGNTAVYDLNSFITNSVYLQLKASAAGSEDLHYTGIQTK